MNYLFFDIECANCDHGNGKICSFGYVKVNESLDVVEENDIIINPKAPFHLRGYGANAKVNIELAYPESVFNSAEPFPKHYDTLKALLTEPDTLLFGYAPENDAGFLRSEFERYRLPMINFDFYDVQRLFKHCTSDEEDGNLVSLSSACEKLGIDPDIANHKSSSDALATAMVLKKLCQEQNLSPVELIKKYPLCVGSLKNGNLTASYFKPRPALLPSEKNMMKSINKDRFKNVLRKLAITFPSCKGKRVCFSWSYEYYHFSEMCVLATELMRNGYRYTAKVSECDIFVKKPSGFGIPCKKLIEAEELSEKRGRPKLIEFNELLVKINLPHRALSAKAARVRAEFEKAE